MASRFQVIWTPSVGTDKADWDVEETFIVSSKEYGVTHDLILHLAAADAHNSIPRLSNVQTPTLVWNFEFPW